MGNLAWLDLETTGLDPERGHILEVAIVITTPELDEVAACAWLPRVSHELAQAACDPIVLNMHLESGLWHERETRPTHGSGELQAQALSFIRAHGAEGSPMCGSTIGFDRSWLRLHMRGLHDAFHYRNLDVSSFKIWFELQGRKLPKANAHRALDDVRESIETLRLMRGWRV